ncbi:autotransporter assembly complex family protein [Rhizobium sp. L1K21]|uniref:autotransporter assembly complex protein TamA n=1 Tax=Rhizobium sp. L1K21 TaxID=2954933 RepID=UPI0020929862|nr:autotransporter assembly complex family protein [Rhizobium sp. L1K21]MCO6188084.1 autotransporter assembly complex protein TamA [Rhizobium sp. L1K21]
MSIAYRRAAPLVAATALAVCLSGLPERAMAFEIFGMKFFEGDDTSDTLRDPVSYSVDLKSSDPELDDFLEEQSNLVQDEDEPVEGSFGLAVKARDDRDRLVAALYEKARYGAIVNVTVDGRDIDALPPSPQFDTSRPVPVEISVEPGPVFKLGTVHLEGDAAPFNPADYGLETGEPAGSAEIIDASSKIVTALKSEGRPLAKLTNRQVVADHRTNTVDVTIAAAGGPVAPFGPVSIDGADAVNPEFIASWSRLETGETYSPDDVKRAAKRLRALPIISSATITNAEELDANGAIPMTITVKEAKPRYFGIGAQVSSNEGLGLEGYWGHRNLFGNAETLKLSGSVSGLGRTRNFRDLDYATSLLFSKPGAFGPRTTFSASLKAAMTTNDSYKEKTLGGGASTSFELTDQDTLTGGMNFAWTENTDAYGTNHYLTLVTPLEWERDATDDKLNPTEGYRVMAKATPGYEFNSKTIFTSLEASASAYYDVGGSTVLAGKLGAGSLLGVSNLGDIPANRRFYLGGGGSVRGYSYQEISPYNAADQALGGRSYIVGSVEARISVSDTFGVVPFLDFGTVGSSATPTFSDFRAGAGVGIRYATPFGPLRLDVAVPLKRYPGGSRFGLYAGIGQAF